MNSDLTPTEGLAYIYTREGPETFKALLEAVRSRLPRLYRQMFHGMILELREVGMIALAELLDTYAATLPDYWDLPNIEPTISGRHWWTKHCQEYKAEWEAKTE